MNWIERRRRSHRRRTLLRVLLVAGAAIGVLQLAGMVLPRMRTTTGALTFARSRETIWRILIDLDGMPRWRSDLTRLERLPDLEGRRTWKETGRGGDRIIQMIVADEPRRLVMRNAESTRREERTIELAEVEQGIGTVVRVVEREPVAPIGRIVALFRGRDLPRLLADLSRWLDGPRPQVASTP
jgi:uncharacterized protein YndB with AHSA1/START domain